MTREQEFVKQTEEAKLESFTVVCARVAELESKNAELKESADSWKERYWVINDVVYVRDESDNKLTKAKELISKLVQLKHRADDPFTYDEYTKLIEEAEQFLKED